MSSQDIQKIYTEYWNNVQNLNWAYLSHKYEKNFSGAGKDPIILLRDSLQYRIGSIFWHLSLLFSTHKSLKKNYLVCFKDGSDSTEYLINSLNENFYIFDDILFNLVSMFDYLGNIICYFCKGQSGLKGKWKTANRLSRDKNSLLEKGGASKTIKGANDNFIRHLAEIRAAIFHYENRRGGIKGSLFLDEEAIVPELKCSISKKLNKFFVRVTSNEKEDVIDLHKSIFEIVQTSFILGNEIIESLKPIYSRSKG